MLILYFLYNQLLVGAMLLLFLYRVKLFNNLFIFNYLILEKCASTVDE